LGYQDMMVAKKYGDYSDKESRIANSLGNRHSMYRFHLMDPIRFQKDFRAYMQALGWRSEGRFLPLQDDIASVAYWYQLLPTSPFPPFYDRDYLEVI
jgi:hypothetical protein